MWWSVVVRGGPSGGPILYGKNTYKFFGGPIFWPFFGGPSKIQIKISHINYIHSFCDFKPSTALPGSYLRKIAGAKHLRTLKIAGAKHRNN